jgi:hypothetical protein
MKAINLLMALLIMLLPYFNTVNVFSKTTTDQSIVIDKSDSSKVYVNLSVQFRPEQVKLNELYMLNSIISKLHVKDSIMAIMFNQTIDKNNELLKSFSINKPTKYKYLFSLKHENIPKIIHKEKLINKIFNISFIIALLSCGLIFIIYHPYMDTAMVLIFIALLLSIKFALPSIISSLFNPDYSDVVLLFSG